MIRLLSSSISASEVVSLDTRRIAFQMMDVKVIRLLSLSIGTAPITVYVRMFINSYYWHTKV